MSIRHSYTYKSIKDLALLLVGGILGSACALGLIIMGQIAWGWL
jgi:hypothetical protein